MYPGGRPLRREPKRYWGGEEKRKNFSFGKKIEVLKGSERGIRNRGESGG